MDSLRGLCLDALLHDFPGDFTPVVVDTTYTVVAIIAGGSEYDSEPGVLPL